MKSNYDKLYQVLIAWYTPDQINEIWAMLKGYDEKIHNRSQSRVAASVGDDCPGIKDHE